MSSVYDLLLKPVVTEKSTLLQEQGKYVFEVLPIANKITIKEILQILQITKQSLSHVLDQLVKQNYIDMSVGNDRRTKVLKLTKKGIELEKKLSKIQITKLKNLLQNSDESDINSFYDWLKPQLNENQNWYGVKDRQSPISNSLNSFSCLLSLNLTAFIKPQNKEFRRYSISALKGLDNMIPLSF